MNSVLSWTLLTLLSSELGADGQLGVNQMIQLHDINTRVGRVPAAQHKLAGFQSLVSDSRAALIEFASGRCGTCQQFKPEWDWVVQELQGLVLTQSFDIDTADGMKQANLAGVLSEPGGVPAVRLYTAAHMKPTALVSGAVVNRRELKASVMKHLNRANLAKDHQGFLLKSRPDATMKIQEIRHPVVSGEAPTGTYAYRSWLGLGFATLVVGLGAALVGFGAVSWFRRGGSMHTRLSQRRSSTSRQLLPS